MKWKISLSTPFSPLNISEKASPLIRAISYPAAAVIVIIISQNFGTVFVFIPCIATGAAYFVLWMGARKEAQEGGAGGASSPDFA